MSEPIIVVRNTVSGVAAEYPETAGRKLLKAWPKVLIEVESVKDEVLSGPYTVDSDGNRVPVDEEISEEDKAPAVSPAKKVMKK